MRIATFQIYWVIGPHVRNGKLMYQPTLWTLNAIITIPSPLLCNQICSRRWRPSEECKCPHTHIHIYTHSLALSRTHSQCLALFHTRSLSFAFARKLSHSFALLRTPSHSFALVQGPRGPLNPLNPLTTHLDSNSSALLDPTPT